MVAIYKRWIEAGWMTLDEVPEMWREAVRAALEN